MLLGALSGAGIGLFFYRQDWLGGYASFRRRILRLGHISFFGIGFLNLLFALSLQAQPLSPGYLEPASWGFLIALITMPLVCFLSAWREGFRHLFFIPVLSLTLGILCLLLGGKAG